MLVEDFLGCLFEFVDVMSARKGAGGVLDEGHACGVFSAQPEGELVPYENGELGAFDGAAANHSTGDLEQR
jgi:hypothetical protein